MKKFTVTDLKNNGWLRREDLDFKDDGTTFKAFEYVNGAIITYTKYLDEYFIAIRVDYIGGKLNYEEYSNLPSYKECDKYNGCYEVDVDDLCRIAERIIKEYDEEEQNLENKKIDTDLIFNELNKEEVLVDIILEKSNLTLDELSKLDSYDIKRLIDSRKRLKDKIEGQKNKLNSSECSKKILRHYEYVIKEYKYLTISNNDYNVDTISKLVKKAKGE